MGRIDTGDAQHETDRRIGRRAPPLAQDTAVIRLADDVVDRQEIGRQVPRIDISQLLCQGGPNLVRNALWIAQRQTFFDQLFQPGLRRPARRDRLFRILIANVRQVEDRPLQQFHGLGKGVGRIGKQTGHLCRSLEMALPIGQQTTPGLINAGPLADTGQHILQVALGRRVIKHIIGRQKRRARPGRDLSQPGQLTAVVPASRHGRPQPDGPRSDFIQTVQQGWQAVPVPPGHDDQQQSLGIGQQIGQIEMTVALDRAAVSQGQ